MEFPATGISSCHRCIPESIGRRHTVLLSLEALVLFVIAAVVVAENHA